MTRRVAAALAVILLVPASPAFATDADRPQPDHARAAQSALAHARGVLAGESRGDATQALLALRHSLSSLSGDDAANARAILARPSQPNVLCGKNACVHWKNPGLLGGGDAPPQTDSNGNGTPDWVETTLQVMNTSWKREIEELGYREPLPDGQPVGLPAGDVEKIDVYLQNVGGQGIYGYAATESGGSVAPAYLVLDNDYKEFGTAPVKALKATAAHELFHAVQFAYDTTDAGWLMESTATWSEEQVYDGVDDNRNYLDSSSLVTPSQPLTAETGGAQYGNWVFYQFISEHIGVGVIRNIWWRASRSGVQARTAIAQALRQAGSGLATTFGQFSTASNIPGRSYQEGNHWPKASIQGVVQFGPGQTSTGQQQVALDALTAVNYELRPGNLSGKWRLRVTLDTPGPSHVAHLLVFKRDGGVERVRIPSKSGGQGSRVVNFSPGKVSKVILDIASSSTQNNRVTRLKATAIR